MSDTKKEIKELKKAYKKSRLYRKEDEAELHGSRLKELLGEGWEAFLFSVENTFLPDVESLAQEVRAKALDCREIMVRAALAPYETRAKELGGGALQYIIKVFDEASSEREALRARDRPTEVAPTEIIYPQLPLDWENERSAVNGGLAACRFGAIMYRYCFVSLWKDGKNRDKALKELIVKAQKAGGAKFEEAMCIAENWLRSAIPVLKEATRRSADSDEEAEVIRKLGGPLNSIIISNRKKKAKNICSAKERSSHKVAISGVALKNDALPMLPETGRPVLPEEAGQMLSGHHPNDVTALKPADSWTVYLDESYRGEEEEFYTGGNSIIAGVVFESVNPLPDLPALHCATDTGERITEADRALETMLHHPNCGVLAMPTRVYDVAMGWEDVLVSWVDVLIRLLPLPDGDSTVKIRICVEPRGDYQRTDDLRALRLVCEKSLKDVFPERARRMKLEFEPLPKPRAGEKSGNAYPDIIGHTCLRRGADNTAKQRYSLSGWCGVCHLDVAPEAMVRVLRCFYRQEPLEEQTWSAVIQRGDVGMFRVLAGLFGKRARENAEEWERYLSYLHGHLVSGAIEMRLLKKQCEWLASYLPENSLPKRVRLTWLTAQLALANHEGRIHSGEEAQRAEFDALCEELFDEMAPVVCEAVLHLAVAYTNEYQFEMALGVIQALLAKDRATVGLSGYGKLLSTAGQHFAFLGDGDRAAALFHEALACFGRLSDEQDKAINMDITRAYLATVTMDSHPAAARRMLSLYLMGDENAADDVVCEECVRLARGNDKKFHHHILLRYLVTLPEDDPLRTAYVATSSSWGPSAGGHPWELIAFYRAMLLPEGNERQSQLETAYRLAVAEGGETLAVIAAVIAGAALVMGAPGEWLERLQRLLKTVEGVAGFVESGRCRILEAQPRDMLPPLELAKAVLPFNFR